MGSRFITSDGATDIGMGCKIRQGYNQGVRQGWKRVLVNINTTSSVFLMGMPVLEYLYHVTQHDVKQNNDVLSEQNRMKFTGKMKSMLQIQFFMDLSVIWSTIDFKLKVLLVEVDVQGLFPSTLFL